MSDDFAPFKFFSHQELQVWLAREFEVREEFEELLGTELEFDAASLDVVEAYLLKRYATPEAALKMTERAVVDAAARHVGLVMILSMEGSKWEVDERKDSVYYRLPIIRFREKLSACPLSMVTTAIDRRTGSFLRELTEKYEELVSARS